MKTVKASTIDVQLVEVTPKLAEYWLEHNDVNRRHRPRLIDCYASDMERGLWKGELTVEPIKISRTSRLLDGQNRAMAVVKHGKPVRMWVATGLEDQAQRYMDLAAARTATDIARLAEMKNSAHTMSIGRADLLNPDGPGPNMVANLKPKASAPQIVDHVMSDPHIELAAEAAVSLRTHLPATPTAIGYAWLQMYRVDPEATSEFFESLKQLTFKQLKDPRKAVLRSLQNLDREMGSANKNKMFAAVSILTRGWNAWRKGEEMETIPIMNRGKVISPVMPI
jgi:hypothetical protein